MKKIILAIALFCAISYNQPMAYSTPSTPTTISYQGVLTDGSDELVADDNYSVTFKLYDVSSGGTELWSETQGNVSTVNGLFNVDLGSVTSVTGVDFTKQLYLEVTVGSTVLSPRIKFTAQPYAFMAKTINETLPLTKGGTGATTEAGARTNLGLGSLAVEDNIGNDMWSGAPLSVTNGGTGGESYADLQTNLGLGELAYLDNISNEMWSGDALSIEHGGTGSTTAEDARDNLGLGTMSVKDYIGNADWSGDDLSVSNGGTGASNIEDARTNLGLGSLATASTINNNNWSGEDLALINGGTGASDAAGARTNLGLGSLATASTINNTNWSGEDLALTNGGTGASDAAGARTNLGLGTIATQGAGAVEITGGTVNGAPIGATTASTGKFTTLEASSFKLPGGTDGQVLSYNATTGNATWADAASGGSGGSGGGAEVLYEDNFNGSLPTNYTQYATYTIPTSGKYLVSVFNAIEADHNSCGYAIESRIFKNEEIIFGNSAATSCMKDTTMDSFTYIETFTANDVIELKISGQNQYDFSGKFVVTKLTAPGGSGGGGTLDLASEDVTGILPLANGGTGATTAAGARTNLGLGSLATKSNINNADWSGEDLALTNGGTGASDAAGARTNLGLGTIATQGAGAIAITGGTVNGTAIGATTASTGKFTTTETGSIKITTGAGANKVLTSDPNGNATWENASSGGTSLSMTDEQTGQTGTIPFNSFGKMIESGNLTAGTYLVTAYFNVTANSATNYYLEGGSTIQCRQTLSGGSGTIGRTIMGVINLSSQGTIKLYGNVTVTGSIDFSSCVLRCVKLF